MFAAVSTSALTGRVTSNGKPVANATVTATSPVLQQARVTVTGASGTYWLGALPPGEYEVTFAHAGLQTLTRRAVVELARVARADAKLEPSEDEETVTSTATTISVVHDTALSTHRDAKALELLPVPIQTYTALYLAPASYPFDPLPVIDDAPVRFQSDVLQSETVEEMTFIREVMPIEYARGGDAAIIARTHSGGEELSVSVRDTITNANWLGDSFRHLREEGLRHFIESASGGHIIPQRLWFFAAGWSGERADQFPNDAHGLQLKLTAQLDARQNLAVTYIDNERSFDAGVEFGSTLTSLVHTAQWSPRVLSEITAGRINSGQSAAPFPPLGLTQNAVAAKVAYVLGDHVVSGGIETESGGFGDERTIFVNDRIWRGRWVVNAGARYDANGIVPGYNPGGPGISDEGRVGAQVAAVYDLRGRGRNALTASASRYTFPLYDTVDELTLGYVMALGSTGTARLHAIQRDYGVFKRSSLQLDSSYRLFDRFEAGFNYTYTDGGSDHLSLQANVANAWFSAEIPIGDQAFGAMIAYRYASPPYSIAIESLHAVDLALRYTLPIRRTALTLAADAQNVFDRGGDAQLPRIVRGWIRIRLSSRT